MEPPCRKLRRAGGRAEILPYDGAGPEPECRFALLFVAAVWAGRLTVIDETSLSLVWPAAGVAVVWFAAQRRAGTLWIDVTALSLITWTLNVATGAAAMQAALFVVANLVQVGLFLGCLTRWAPHLWGAGGDEPLRRLSDLGALLAAAAVSTLCGAAIGPTAVWLYTANYSWETTAVWLARNMVSVVLIGAVGLRLGHLISRRYGHGAGGRPTAARRALLKRLVSAKAVELLAVIVGSVAACAMIFGPLADLHIAFPLLALTVWAALRFDTTLVLVHGLAMGIVVVLLTLDGLGPFAQIQPPATRAFVVQLFVGVVAVVALAVSLGRDERDLLLAQVRQGQQESEERAQLFATVVDSMAEGLMVIDSDHRFLLCNPAAEELLGRGDAAGTSVGSAAEYGVLHADGRPMTDSEQPYLRALAGEEVRNLDLIMRNPAAPGGRTLSVNALPLSTPQGTAAVVVFSDVTAERRHRDELTSFAGVVAHDLLNPLTTVEGWTQVLRDELEANSGAPASLTSDALSRIQRASLQMRHLIHDLLSYTTARDGLLRPVDLDLRAVVNDIVVARSETPGVESSLRPKVSYGSLHRVRGIRPWCGSCWTT